MFWLFGRWRRIRIPRRVSRLSEKQRKRWLEEWNSDRGWLQCAHLAIEWNGRVSKRAAPLIARLARKCWEEGVIVRDAVREILALGAPLGPEWNKKLGVSRSWSVGDAWRPFLVHGGEEKAAETFANVLHDTIHRHITAFNRVNSSPRFVMAIFLPVTDSRTCEAALQMAGDVFHIDHVPELPLPGCDAVFCRCAFGYCRPGRTLRRRIAGREKVRAEAREAIARRRERN